MADKVLTDVRIQLIEGLTLAVIKQLLDVLRKEKVLNREEADSIKEENPTTADKARNLIDSVNKKGLKASKIMLDNLKECDECLYDKLELDRLLQSPCKVPAPGAPAGLHTDPDQDDDKEYTMDSNPRGFCVIINNMEFKKAKHNREGSDYDADALEKVFAVLGFTVDLHENLKAKEIKELMLDYKKKRHGDCFVCCVLSHGNKDGVQGADMKMCTMTDILSPFDGKTCPSLAGKPKVFFIQACRGKKREDKVKVFADDAAKADDTPSETYTIPARSDFLVAMSTVEDFVSYRDSNGSWFIQSLCSHLEEGSRSGEDILTILTKVNDDVSRKEGVEEVNQKYYDAKMTPEPRFTLRKKLIFKIPDTAV